MNSPFSFTSLLAVAFIFSLFSCDSNIQEEVSPDITFDNVMTAFGDNIDMLNLPNYANQDIPAYIDKDNTSDNEITDAGALLGRVLFYDTKLSSDNTISCASCHHQSLAFGDDAVASTGVNGSTGRHAMRLINARFSDEEDFFWDERADNLEEQTTMPIQDHFEMGFSGQNGDPDLDSLINRLSQQEYYNELFTLVYGDGLITEERMQNALAQFIRSIVSFDSKYDIGRASAGNNNAAFSNFSDLENEGKRLFMQRPDFNRQGVRVGGGLDCNTCHRAPEFDIDPNSRNNGITGSFDGTPDTDVTRSPTLRDLFNTEGVVNGPFMHNGFSSNFDDVLNHYESIAPTNNLDRRLARGRMGGTRDLNISNQEREAITAFVKTLSGSNAYTDPKWSDPFR
ncbi:cytochrome c peroxidase [Reichenbachiella sp.]|uniref:cytochrome-c peroxidase n=1 Tax=Reichenbachiella sp. TaxID=2184521 RepID=UPI0032980CDA